MDVETFLQYQDYGKSASDEYLTKIKKAKEREDLSVFYDVMDQILTSGKTLEQESMLIEIK